MTPSEMLEKMSGTASIVISIAMILFLGFAMTRITKKLRLPNVTAYILVGILIGPYCFNLVPTNIVNGMDFLSDIALAFIAFSAGEFFRFSALKKNGLKVIVITLLEAFVASGLVFAVSYFLLRLNLAFCIVLAALAAATSPASTVMTIRQTGAKGDFVDTLMQVIALDVIVSLLMYSVALSVATATLDSISAVSVMDVIEPLLINIGVLILGGGFGAIMKLMMPQNRSTDNRLIIALSLLFAFCGVCALLDISPLLGCMSMGTVYINMTGNEKLFRQINYFSPPILLMFFVRSGLNFNLGALTETSSSVGAVPLIVVGLVYFAVRIAGKYGGSLLGCLVAGKPKKTRNFFGLALIPQAGVAIGLAAIGARALGGDTGAALNTIILASSVLCELVGPVCAKLSLHLSGSYSDKLEDLVEISATSESGKAKSEVELLIERIQKIQTEIPEPSPVAEDEEAFTEAAEERQIESHRISSFPFNRFRRR